MTVVIGSIPDTPNPGRRTARLASGRKVAFLAAARAILSPDGFGHALMRGGGVANAYGYPAQSQMALATASIPDGKIVLRHGWVGASGMTDARVGNIYPAVRPLYDSRYSSASRLAAIAAIKTDHAQAQHGGGIVVGRLGIHPDVLAFLGRVKGGQYDPDIGAVLADYLQENRGMSDETADALRRQQTLAGVLEILHHHSLNPSSFPRRDAAEQMRRRSRPKRCALADRATWAPMYEGKIGGDPILHRRVFADFLHDRDDPRHMVLRASAREMEHTPISGEKGVFGKGHSNSFFTQTSVDLPDESTVRIGYWLTPKGTIMPRLEWQPMKGGGGFGYGGYATFDETRQFLEEMHRHDPEGTQPHLDYLNNFEKNMARRKHDFGPDAPTLYHRRSQPIRYKLDAGRAFVSALRRLRSKGQKALHGVAQDIAKTLRLAPARTRDAIHDTPELSTPSIAQAVASGDPATVRYAASWYGLLTRTPVLAVFHVSHTGPDSVYKFKLSGSGEEARGRLDKAGLHSRVLIPTRQGFDVVIYDPGRQQRDRVKGFVRANGVVAQESVGQGEVMGHPDPAQARAKYREEVMRFEQGPKRMARERGSGYSKVTYHEWEPGGKPKLFVIKPVWNDLSQSYHWKVHTHLYTPDGHFSWPSKEAVLAAHPDAAPHKGYFPAGNMMTGELGRTLTDSELQEAIAHHEAPKPDWRPDSAIPEDFYGYSRPSVQGPQRQRRSGRPARYSHEAFVEAMMKRRSNIPPHPATVGALGDYLTEQGSPIGEHLSRWAVDPSVRVKSSGAENGWPVTMESGGLTRVGEYPGTHITMTHGHHMHDGRPIVWINVVHKKFYHDRNPRFVRPVVVYADTPQRQARRGRPARKSNVSHQDFHTAMLHEPNNRVHPLAYADWLEERGMPTVAGIIRAHVNGEGHGGIEGMELPSFWHGHDMLERDLRDIGGVTGHEAGAYRPGAVSARTEYDPSSAAPDGITTNVRIASLAGHPKLYFSWSHWPRRGQNVRDLWRKLYDEGVYLDGYARTALGVVAQPTQARQLQRRGRPIRRQTVYTRRPGKPRRYSLASHANFHAAMIAHPGDMTHRRVYADFLDENDMPGLAEVYRRSADHYDAGLSPHLNPVVNQVAWRADFPIGGTIVDADNFSTIGGGGPAQEGVANRDLWVWHRPLSDPSNAIFHRISVSHADGVRLLQQLHAEGTVVKPNNIWHPTDARPGQERLSRRGRPRRYSNVSESDFHKAIVANPNGDHHIIYADWLEDQGKPNLAALVRSKPPRLTTETRPLPHPSVRGPYRDGGVLISHVQIPLSAENQSGYNVLQWTIRTPPTDAGGSSPGGVDRHNRLLSALDDDGVAMSWPARDAVRNWRHHNQHYDHPPAQFRRRPARLARVGPGEPLMGTDFIHPIHDDAGQRIGHVWVTPLEGGSVIRINHIGAMGNQPNSLGPSKLMGLARQLRVHYPNVKRYVGLRVSGMGQGRRPNVETRDKLARGDRLPGGIADRMPASSFPSRKVAAGAKVEREHTSDPGTAREIARDHLAEDPDYYKKLRQMESSRAKSKTRRPKRYALASRDHYGPVAAGLAEQWYTFQGRSARHTREERMAAKDEALARHGILADRLEDADDPRHEIVRRNVAFWSPENFMKPIGDVAHESFGVRHRFHGIASRLVDLPDDTQLHVRGFKGHGETPTIEMAWHVPTSMGKLTFHAPFHLQHALRLASQLHPDAYKAVVEAARHAVRGSKNAPGYRLYEGR